MFIDVVSEAEASGELADYYRRQRAAWGFLPDYAGAFATRPDLAAIWDQLNGAIRNSMPRRRFEIVTIAAARALGSTYCTAAHSKFLRDVCDDPDAVQKIAEHPDGSDLSPADRVAFQFAAKVATDAAAVTQADVDELRSVANLTDAEVADIVFAVAARAFFTRVIEGLGARLDAATADTFSPALRAAMVVGRPIGPA